MIVLEVDHVRSNSYTIDYDTDLESPWSNLSISSNLFPVFLEKFE